jgi:hypothetical protein
MAKTDLLKQAIADAKAVKETALANAKLALQEAFQPTMMRMISDQIENEVDGEEEMPAEEPEMDMSAEEQGMEGDAGMENDFNWTDDHLSASVGGNDYDFTVGMDVEDELEPEANDEDMDAEYADTDAVANDDNLDLESIIRELEEDLDAEPEMEVDMEEPNMTDEGMYYESHDYGHSEDDAEEDSLKDIIEAILREEEMMPPADDELTAEDMDMVEPIKAELEEAYKTVRQLRSIINEVNLLNAKLLFTNKLFRNFELSENQKMKVIENFDRAGNPREVKLVFTTLAEAFKKPQAKRVVKESFASRATTTTAPSRQTTQVLSEGFELANRWKKLAGLL